MSTAIQGLRGTGQFDVNFRPTNYRELFTLLEPNGSAPLNALLAMAASEQTDDPKYNNFQDELPDRQMTVNNVGGYPGTGGVQVLQLTATDPVAYILKGSVVVNARTGEVMQATLDGDTTAHTISVTRQIGGTTLVINQGDKLFVAGFAAAEGSGAPTAISFDPLVDYNYTQIFKTPFQVTGTLQNTYRRTGNAETEYMTKALKLHMMDIERAMFFGKRVENNGTTAQPTRFTGGVMNLITNITDCSTFSSPGIMDEKTFDRTLIENIFAWGSKQKVCFGGARIASLLQAIGKDRWTPRQIDNAYGILFTRYVTFAGDLLFYLHPQFRQISGMDKTMVVLDLPYVKYRFLQNRDTRLYRNIQLPDEDSVKHQYMTECGLELLQGKPHAIIKAWSDIA